MAVVRSSFSRVRCFGFLAIAIPTLCASPAWGYLLTGRWTNTQTDGLLGPHDPATVTWSIVPDGVSTSRTDPGGSDLVAFFDRVYSVPSADRTTDLTNRPWWQVMNRLMNKYTRTSGITMVYLAEQAGTDQNGNLVNIGPVADLRSAGKTHGGAILGAATSPNSGDIHFRTNDDYSPSETEWRKTFAHEVGHAVGIGHDSVTNHISVMDGSGGYQYFGVQFDDVYAMNRHYGDPLEKNGGNNTTASATDLGDLAVGGVIARGTDINDMVLDEFDDDIVGIHHAGDVDFFAFTLTEAARVQIDVSPVGPTYTSREIDNNNPVNFMARADLNLTLTDTGGNVLVSADAGLVGTGESIDNWLLSPGDYLIRVDGDEDLNQFYSLTASAGVIPEPASLALLALSGVLAAGRRRTGR